MAGRLRHDDFTHSSGWIRTRNYIRQSESRRDRWMHGLPVRDSADALHGTWIEFEIQRLGQRTYYNTFFTSLPATAENVGQVARLARARWEIEKKTFNCLARKTLAACASALRAFFRCAEDYGWCRRGLVAVIPLPRQYSPEASPAGSAWEDVQRLLASTAGDRPADVRDRAILLLLAVYGLRSGEVRGLPPCTARSSCPCKPRPAR